MIPKLKLVTHVYEGYMLWDYYYLDGDTTKYYRQCMSIWRWNRLSTDEKQRVRESFKDIAARHLINLNQQEAVI